MSHAACFGSDPAQTDRPHGPCRTQVPVPKGPLLDDKEKERLARMMQYR